MNWCKNLKNKENQHEKLYIIYNINQYYIMHLLSITHISVTQTLNTCMSYSLNVCSSVQSLSIQRGHATHFSFPIKLNLSSPTTKFCFIAQRKFPFHQIGEKEKGAEAKPICLADPELSRHRRAHNRVSLQQSSSVETKTGPSIHSFPAALGNLLFLISPGVEGKRALVASLTTLSMC